GADFVQLGYHSVPLEAAAPLCKARGLGFGCSCHSLEQARQAVAAGASYIYLGTIFATASKPGVQAAGVGLVREVCSQVTDIPVFAIGGMSAATAPQVAAAGAFGCAAVSALWRPGDPRTELAAMSRAFGPGAY
ncbi:thiamine phosphate synthase, partial [bacterium]|nr:thiamine phosphate synthase [bacterium]